MAETSEPTQENNVAVETDGASALTPMETAAENEAPKKAGPKKSTTKKPAAKKATPKKPAAKKAPSKRKPAAKQDAEAAVDESTAESPEKGQESGTESGEATPAKKKTASKKPAAKTRAPKKAAKTEEPAADAQETTPTSDNEVSADSENTAKPSGTTQETPEAEQAHTTSAVDEFAAGSPFEVPTATLDMLFHVPAAKSASEDEPTSTRRRRRRRRGEEDLEIQSGEESDPPGTVIKVRAPRNGGHEKPVDHVVAVKGSTRLEAKRQRRRESRESGRRRHGITEAEFLARRESVDRKMVVKQNDERIQIGVIEDGVLAEHFVSHTTQDSMIGNVYVGRVQNVLPSMEAAFVDIGRGRNAVLYAGEVDWAKAKLDGKPRRIENALRSGDSVLVQVTKDPVGHKGARLTSQISLPGRYLVYVPAGSMTGISRKLPDTERARLKKVLKEHLPDKAGVIVRTAAEGASEQELMNDINRLRVQWEGIEKVANSTKTKAPELLYSEPDLMIKVVRAVFNEDFSKLVVQGDHAWDTIEAYVTYVAPDLVDRLEKWDGEDDLFTHMRVDEQIYKALERKVNLPSGGSLVIDRTEAMTVIDVNTGKFTGSGGNLEETVTKNNLEAAEEIVRQMRLRDMGGIIVVDFIDMVLESNRDLVLRRLVECLGRDRTKHQVAEVTSLGLVQMTRKKIGTGLLEVFSENCEACAGRGVVIHDEPLQGHSHQQQPVQSVSDRPTRSERRRQRQAQEEAAKQPVAPTDPEGEERAQKTRAALASIAAASGHAGEVAGATPDESGDNSDAVSEAKAKDMTVVTEGRGGGEEPRANGDDESETQRPRRRRRRGRRGRGGRTGSTNAEQPQAAHDATAEDASDQSGAEPATAPSAAVAGSDQAKRAASKAADTVVVESAPSSPTTAQRPARRRRAAASAAGTDASVTVVNTQETGRGHRVSSSADVPASGKADKAPQASSEPVMLGVGVPASEL